jgi:hypothetical protein
LVRVEEFFLFSLEGACFFLKQISFTERKKKNETAGRFLKAVLNLKNKKKFRKKEKGRVI